MNLEVQPFTFPFDLRLSLPAAESIDIIDSVHLHDNSDEWRMSAWRLTTINQSEGSKGSIIMDAPCYLDII